jgi:hypothetical protein
MWGPLVSPLGQTEQNGLVEPNQTLNPLAHPLSHDAMATELLSPSPPRSSRLRPSLANHRH